MAPQAAGAVGGKKNGMMKNGYRSLFGNVRGPGVACRRCGYAGGPGAHDAGKGACPADLRQPGGRGNQEECCPQGEPHAGCCLPKVQTCRRAGDS